MAETAPLLRQCIDDVTARAPDMLDRVIEHAVPELQAAENKSREVAQRDRLSLAWRGLLQHKPQWLRTFPGLLKKRLLAAAAQGDTVARATVRSSGLGELSLVDDGKVVESLESARLLQDLLPAVEHELAALDVLMSSVVGQDVIRPELNPLRPEMFAQVLRELVAPAEPDAEIRSLWLRYLARPVGAELKLLYPAMVELLQRAHVREAGYRVRLMTGAAGLRPPQAQASAGGPGVGGAGGGSGGGSGAGSGGGAASGSGAAHGGGVSGFGGLGDLPAMPQLGRARSAIGHHVFHQFLGQGGARYDAPLAPGYYHAVDEELAAIDRVAAAAQVDVAAQQRLHAQYRAMPAVDRPVRPVDVGSQLSTEGWGGYASPHERDRALMQLKRKAQQVNQVVGLDVVRTLVDQVAHDPLLLAPVREAVVALEPALLQLAMDHPRFFAEDDHPARRLVESVAQRSFRYNDEYASEFGEFFEPVQKAFNELNAAATDDPQAFGNALARLQQGWDTHDQQALETHDNGLQSIRFAEERQAMADQVAWDLSQRPDLDNVPGMILDFLYADWALVIAHAKLVDKRNQLDPGGYRTTVSDLLWSVKKDVTLKRPVKLIEMVPGLVATLHSGLDLLGKEREETKPFFDALMRLHNPVLKLRRARTRREAAESASAPLTSAMALLGGVTSMSMDIDETLAATEEQRKPRKAAQPWLGRHELDAAGFEETLPTDYAELATTAAAPHVAAPGADGDEAPAANEALLAEDGELAQDPSWVLDSLHEGAWVDLYSKRQWLRAQLIWASTKGTLFMFVSRGGRPHSMTKRSCEKLIRGRLLRPVKTGAVVDKAMAAMAGGVQDAPSPLAEPLAA
ncbi:MAG: DUF1631 family protein [Ramlibacter sp.]|nr:DUF1631 family protein [Ramlibacter sp.]